MYFTIPKIRESIKPRGGGKSQPVMGVVFIILGVLTLLSALKG